MAAGTFERWGVTTGVGVLLGCVAVCTAEVGVGVLLWLDATSGPWLALTLLPIERISWTGFALPFGPLLGLARTAMLVAIRVPGE